MQPSRIVFSELLASEKKYIIPVYQRKYTWGTGNCQTLFNDIMDLLEDETSSKEHFFGTCALAPCPGRGNANTSTIIDGQQRITTVTILLKAVQDLSEKYNKSLSVDSNTYFYDAVKKDGKQILRLEHRHESDKHSFELLMNNSKDCISQFQRNYKWFIKELDREYKIFPNKSCFFDDIRDVIVNNLYLIQLKLDKGEDPQIVFQTINSTGVPLSITDLIKNYLLLEPNLDGKTSEQLYEEWLRIENTAKIIDESKIVNSSDDSDDDSNESTSKKGNPGAKNQEYLSKFIRTFIMYKQCSNKVPPFTESLKLYEKFVQYYSNRTSSKTQIMNEMLSALKIYKFIENKNFNNIFDNFNLNDPDLQMTLNRIRNIRPHQEWYPFFMHIIEDFIGPKTAIQTIDILKNTLNVFLKYVFMLTISNQKKTINSQVPDLFNKVKKLSDASFDINLDQYLRELRGLFTRDEFVDFICCHKLNADLIDIILNDLSDFTLPNRCSTFILQDVPGGKPQKVKDEYLGNVTKSNVTKSNAKPIASLFQDQLTLLAKDSAIHFINEDFATHNRTDWNNEDIKRRSRRLADRLADHYCFDNVIPNHDPIPTNGNPSSIDTHAKAILFGKDYPLVPDSLLNYWYLFKDLVKALSQKIDSNDRLNKWLNLPYEETLEFNNQTIFSESKNDDDEVEEINIQYSDAEKTLFLSQINTPDVLIYFQNTLLPFLGYSPSDITFE